MNHAVRVRGGDAADRGDQQLHRGLGFHVTDAVEDLGERITLQQFHYQPSRRGVLDHIEHGDNVGVVDTPGRESLTAKT